MLQYPYTKQRQYLLLSEIHVLVYFFLLHQQLWLTQLVMLSFNLKTMALTQRIFQMSQSFSCQFYQTQPFYMQKLNSIKECVVIWNFVFFSVPRSLGFFFKKYFCKDKIDLNAFKIEIQLASVK